MWTAACCDSSAASQPAITQKGFSFGYLRENKADGSVEVLSIRELENAISAIPAEAAGQERSIRIFVDDYCNEDSDNSKEALAKIGAVVDKSNLNNQDTLGQTTLYKLPLRRDILAGVNSKASRPWVAMFCPTSFSALRFQRAHLRSSSIEIHLYRRLMSQ